jgi:peptidoglycan biosynthesis protein MviN/MurJ (putative lipid II flippase)
LGNPDRALFLPCHRWGVAPLPRAPASRLAVLVRHPPLKSKLSDTNRAVGRLGVISLVNVLLGLANSLLIVHTFGVSREIEIYFAATISMGTVDRMFNVGSATEILIPSFLRQQEEEGKEAAMTAFSLISNWFILASTLAALAAAAAAPLLLGMILPGFEVDEVQRASDLFRILAIFIPLKVFNGMCSTPFRAQKIYTVHERTGIVNKIVLTALLLSAADSVGVVVLVGGAAFGVVLRSVYIAFLLRRNGLRYRLLLRSRRFSVYWLVRRIYIPFVQSLGLQVSRWIELAAFTLLPVGTLALYQYVKQLYLTYYSNVSKSIGTVFLTEVSAQENRHSREHMLSYMLKVSFISVFSLILCVSLGREFLQLVWASRDFGPEDLSLAYYLLILFFSTMLMSMVENLYLRSNVARDDVARQYLGSLVILTGTSILFLALSGYLGFAAVIVVGLLKCTAQLAYSAYLNYSRNPAHFVSFGWGHLLKAGLLVAVVPATVILVFDAFVHFGAGNERLLSILLVAAKGVAATGLFLLANRVLRVYDLRRLLAT